MEPRVSIMEPKWRANQARGAVKRPFGEKYAFLMPLGVPCEPNNAISESFLGALSDLGSVLGAILTMLGGQSHEKWDQKSVWKSITNMLCQILKKWIEKYAWNWRKIDAKTLKDQCLFATSKTLVFTTRLQWKRRFGSSKRVNNPWKTYKNRCKFNARRSCI